MLYRPTAKSAVSTLPILQHLIPRCGGALCSNGQRVQLSHRQQHHRRLVHHLLRLRSFCVKFANFLGLHPSAVAHLPRPRHHHHTMSQLLLRPTLPPSCDVILNMPKNTLESMTQPCTSIAYLRNHLVPTFSLSSANSCLSIVV